MSSKLVECMSGTKGRTLSVSTELPAAVLAMVFFLLVVFRLHDEYFARAASSASWVASSTAGPQR